MNRQLVWGVLAALVIVTLGYIVLQSSTSTSSAALQKLTSESKSLRTQIEQRDTIIRQQTRDAQGQPSALEAASLPAFSFLQHNTVSSVMIEIGLHNEIATPEPGQHVIGIEASLKSIQQNPQLTQQRDTTVLNAAMGEERGVADWFERPGLEQANSLSSQPEFDKDFSVSAVATIVPVIRLEDVLAKVPAHVQIAMVKVDAQGHNYHVLKGGGSLLRNAAVIFTECSTDMDGVRIYGQPLDACSNIRSMIEAMGYTWMGNIYESPEDRAIDMAFTHQQNINTLRGCWEDFQGNNTKRYDSDEVKVQSEVWPCLNTKMHNLLTTDKIQH